MPLKEYGSLYKAAIFILLHYYNAGTFRESDQSVALGFETIMSFLSISKIQNKRTREID